MPKLAWNGITDSYMVVWQNSGIVYGRLLDVNGMPLSNITTISEIPGATTSSITAVANGWIVVWSHQLAIDPQEGGDANLYGQWIHSNGSLNEDNFILVSSQGDQKLPVLASDPISGYYLAAWQDNRTMNDGVFFALTH